VISVICIRTRARFGAPQNVRADELLTRSCIGSVAFASILVGKDGGVKLRSNAPVSAERLSNVIDAMPMRRREMREQNGA